MNAAEFKAQIDEQLKDIESLPSMPAIVNRLLALAYDPDVDIKALAEEISKDPGITASIIKLSNSAYFSPGSKIRSVHEAIVNLGLNVVKDIVIIIASKDILRVPLEAYKQDEKALWDHCLLVGELASRIARRKKTRTPADVAFTGGLLHDIGKVVIIKHFARIYRQIVMEMDQDPQARFSELEKKYLGYNQNEIGGMLLKTWEFPEELVEAATHVNHPSKAAKNPELCSIVHVANMLALSSGVGVDIGGMNEALSDFALKTLTLSEEDMQELYLSVPEYCKSLEALSAD